MFSKNNVFSIIDFIGRQKETNLFNQIISNNQSSLSVVFGRRRVGKTFWLDASTKNYIIENKNENVFYLYFSGSLDKKRDAILKDFHFTLKKIVYQNDFKSLQDHFVQNNFGFKDRFKSWSDFFIFCNYFMKK